MNISRRVGKPQNGGSSLDKSLPKESRVLVVAKDDSIIKSIASDEGFKIVAHGPSLEMFLPVLKNTDLDLLIIEPEELRGIDLERLASLLHSFWPNLKVITSDQLGSSFKSLYLDAIDDAGEGGDMKRLVSALRPPDSEQHGWREELRLKVGRMASGQAIPRFEESSGMASPNLIHSPQLQVGCRVVTVFSPKGGVGKTFIATNLAVMLAAKTPFKVAIVDLDLNSSDIAVHLGLFQGPTIVDMLPFFDELRPEILKKFVVHHRSTGLDAVLGPRRPELSELIKTDAVQKLLEVMVTQYNVIIVDTPPDPGNDIACDCLENSHAILLVTGTDVASLRQAKIALEVLKKLNSSIPDRCHLVVNRWPGPASLSIPQLEAFFGHRICAVVQDDRRAVESSIMAGRPFVMHNKSHPITSSLTALTNLFYPIDDRHGDSQVAGNNRSWFSGMWRRLKR